ncbi:MAG: hypothetical protein CR982_08785 [Candidatus Cloacimonadota bacterium]|nr:MAG: hypothetical protein CR982_08785 [Candidatus Cloacimonadota bacterium]PIE77729.1 MAG: hypothetical protein CSA15_11440 [Candidatus Delongbacteria bacterium]
MNNNDIFRRVRYIFDLSDYDVIDIFKLADCKVSRAEVISWLKRDDDESFISMRDSSLSTFLNGFIALKRGKREGVRVVSEKSLNNNIILRKFKIALELKDEDIVKILFEADFNFSKHEVNALFRKKGHKHYRDCKDQILRNFLKGLQLIYRDKK